MKAVAARFIVAALSVPAIAACSPEAQVAEGAPSREPRSGGTVVIAAAEDIDAANPLVSQLGVPREFLRTALFLPLIRYDPNLELRPGLASEWQMTADTGVVFTLRDDVTWHDGRRTTAYDVKFTFDRARDPATAFPGAGELSLIGSAEVVDSFTIRFSWEPHREPMAAFPFFPAVPRHMLDTIAPAEIARSAFNRAPVGNGPYRFVRHVPGDRWEFEANPDYPESLGGRPHIDRLIWRVVPEGTSRTTELLTGGAQVTLGMTADAFEELKADPAVNPIIRESRNYALIGWNGRRAPLGDPSVRRALMMAIDRQTMVDALRAGLATIAIGPVGPYHWAYAGSIDPLPFDTAAARGLLAEAGIQDRDGDGTLDLPDGRPFSFELSYASEQAFARDIAEVIERDLAAIGVRARLASSDFNSLVGRMTSSGRDFDAVILGWESDYRVNIRDLFHSSALSGPFQIAGYANSQVDALIDSVSMTFDREAARPIYHRLQTILRDEQPWGFLYYFPELNATSTRMKGVVMDVRGAFPSIGGWWLNDPSLPVAQ